MDWLLRHIEHPLLFAFTTLLALACLRPFFAWFFGDWRGLLEDVRDAGMPDLLMLFRGRWFEGEWAELKIGVLDLTAFDRLVVTGKATLGTLTVQFDFAAGDRFQFLSAGALGLDAAQLSFQSNGLDAGLGIAVDSSTGALVMRIVELRPHVAASARFAAAPVPLPPALGLFGVSLLGLVARRRRG